MGLANKLMDSLGMMVDQTGHVEEHLRTNELPYDLTVKHPKTGTSMSKNREKLSFNKASDGQLVAWAEYDTIDAEWRVGGKDEFWTGREVVIPSPEYDQNLDQVAEAVVNGLK